MCKKGLVKMQLLSAIGKRRATSDASAKHNLFVTPQTTSALSHKAGTLEQPVTAGRLPLHVVRTFIETLNRKAVRYCHWKSNIRLPDTLSGVEDIDILVNRGDAEAFREAMLKNGFKRAQSRSGIGHPGVFHALSLDEATGELAHLHAYYQIVSGDSLVKNYRLKIEDLLLHDTIDTHGVMVPSREAELVVFALRMILKHVSPVEILMVNRHYSGVAHEMAWLRQQADADRAAALCTAFFPSISPLLFKQMLDAIGNESALARRIVLGWQIAWRLRGERRLGFLHASLSRSWRVFSLLLGRIRRRKDLALQTGGLVVALVGPKATGKSTLSNAIAKRLGRELNVQRLHVGKPPATALTFITRAFMPIARQLFKSERPSEYQKPERRHEQNYSLIHVVHMTLLAYERRNLLRRAFRMAAAGDIVVCDRYPSSTIGAIDSSCFDDAAISKCGSSLKRRLMMMERALYKSMPKPDLVIRLMAPINTTIQRDAERVKAGGPDCEAVQRRRVLESEADYDGLPVVHIDTNRSINETIRDVVSTVWAAL
jgi:thymidylate kinase